MQCDIMIPRIVFTFTLRTNILKWINVKGFILVVVTVIRTSSLWAYSSLLSDSAVDGNSAFCRSVTHWSLLPRILLPALAWWLPDERPADDEGPHGECQRGVSRWAVLVTTVLIPIHRHSIRLPSCLNIVFQHTASYRQPSTCSTDTPSSPMFSTINF